VEIRRVFAVCNGAGRTKGEEENMGRACLGDAESRLV